MRKPKQYVKLLAEERQKLNRQSKRKLISPNAKKQIQVILFFDDGGTMVVTAEKFAVSFQTLMKWRKAFKKDRLDSLLVFLENKKETEEENDDDKKDIDNDETEG